MFKHYLFIFLLAMPAWLSAQHSLRGTVIDAETNEILPGATVVLEKSALATATNSNGQFVLDRIRSGEYTLRISYVGYTTIREEILINGNVEREFKLERSSIITEEVFVTATRASEKTATTYTEISKKELEKNNLGQDIPFLLNMQPSVVVDSDAGAGVGYTGIKIRGSDPTRINVTVNGIPLNDSESHGVFWVNMPDFVSSVDNIQIQRGVGTSTNGAAAFGATINIQTTTLNPEPYAEAILSGGSFNTNRQTVRVGTGLINGKFAVDARLSRLYSDGYIERAFSDLKSFFVSAGYYGDNSMLKLNIFSGKEQTYQAWYGVPQDSLATNRRYNFYTYDNETDNYQQDHYQLIYAKDFQKNLTLNAALHYTKGRGYYEQFRPNDRLSRYNIAPIQIGDTEITRTDIIRRRWLDNDFYGATASIDYRPDSKWQIIGGGGWNRYLGDHFGEIIWAGVAHNSINIRDNYYFNDAVKTDFHYFAKGFYEISPRFTSFLDLQMRHIDYSYQGFDNNLVDITGNPSFVFFNPKAGLTYFIDKFSNVYASVSVGNREPVRRDFVDAPEGKTPTHETLINPELGYRLQKDKLSFNSNLYFMAYRNQLVLTGEINDVGSAIRTNVDRSYRAGIENQVTYAVNSKFNIGGNLTLSRNKILQFDEIIYDYLSDGSVNELFIQHENVDISFSPNLIAGGIASYMPLPNMELTWMSKYVGRQFLDNTSSLNRSIDAFFVNDFRAIYKVFPKGMKELNFSLLVNNVFNELYAPNGYTFGYGVDGTLIYENYFYPQAGTNFLLGLTMKF